MRRTAAGFTRIARRNPRRCHSDRAQQRDRHALRESLAASEGVTLRRGIVFEPTNKAFQVGERLSVVPSALRITALDLLEFHRPVGIQALQGGDPLQIGVLAGHANYYV